MKLWLVVAVFLVGILTGIAQSEAKKAIRWKKVAGWEIRVDQTLGYGCFLFAGFEKGTVLRLGFAKSIGAYLMIGDLAWKSLERGKNYKLRIKFDEDSWWSADATALDMNGVTALTVMFTNADFIHEFARRHTIFISYRGKSVANLKLKGTYAAVKELVNCQKSMAGQRAADSGSISSGDPFASSTRPTRTRDPFAN